MALRLLILLPKYRSTPGRLQLLDDAGSGVAATVSYQCLCLAKSDQADAELHNNPTRNPLLPFGDLPLGEYIAIKSIRQYPVRSYGTSPVWTINPISGDAKTAQSKGRWGLLIHGGM